jgi:N-acetyl sugar amidotransferase
MSDNQTPQRCNRCLMDTSDREIQFFDDGSCNHCNGFLAARERYLDEDYVAQERERIVSQVKKAGVNSQYDCLVGVSGGVDSTYVCYIAKRLGLRPLAVHVDNGWNSELAVKNIESALNVLGVDLVTEVLDWEEFRLLQLSMLRASTPDIELPTDHAIRAVLMRTASKMNIRYILNGRNYSTEGILPWSWAYSAIDYRYISGMYRRFMGGRLKNYPHLALPHFFYYVAVRKIRNFNILNYVEYNKDLAMDILKNELGWRDYGGKHHESIYTRFLQGYILPRKFGIDKRIAHMSVLVLTGQIGREEALQELERPICDHDLLEKDLSFFLKKLGLSEEEFRAIMSESPKSYQDYPNHSTMLVPGKNDRMIAFLRVLRRIGILPSGFADNALAIKG